MTDGLYARLERSARELTGEGFLRLSRDESALFAADFPRREGAAHAHVAAIERAGWKTVLKDGLCFLTPSVALCERLCPALKKPDAPWRRENAFALLMRRDAQGVLTDEGLDEGFLLCLLRAVGRARLQDPQALTYAKAAYARSLAEKKNARTALTAVLARELCEAMAGGNGI
ncbi:MAG: hypothetical protein IJ174_07970 [Clostridia bacterium]|nr:hypothetical protein [Clostridia bacterium]